MNIDIVRAWKDAAYRASLSAEEQAQLPANPAGAVELSDAELENVHGAQAVPPTSGNPPTYVNRVETNGLIGLHTVQLTIGISLIPVLSPTSQNAVCN